MASRYLDAVLKITELLEEFLRKNPIEGSKIDLNKFRKKIDKLRRDEQDAEKIYNSLNRILSKYKSIIKKRIIPDIFYIFGCHGGVIIDNKGFCEFDSPLFAINRLIEKMSLSIETKKPYNLEIATCCLEWLSMNLPKEFSEFLKFYKQGQFEIINPTYSQPYNLLIGAEANIKQFEYGLKALKHLGLESEIYYASESSIHPQIPQILEGFNISKASLRARLLGVNPTAISAHINWIGRDNTKIDSLIDQSGLYNGEFFHGTFFKEIPNLLFQAVSRPFVNQILYSSLEDFVMPLPYQEEVWRTAKNKDIFGKFLSCSDAFKHLNLNGEYKYLRDQFLIGDYVFIPSDLFLHNKNTEISLLTAEIVNCILGFFEEIDNDAFLEDSWKKLLLTQAHDCYAVPFIRTGDYSISQLSKSELEDLNLTPSELTISEISIDLLKEVQKECKIFVNQCLGSISEKLIIKERAEEILENFLIFNPIQVPRRECIEIEYSLPKPQEIALFHDNKEIPFEYEDGLFRFIAEIPAFGYSIYSLINKKENNVKKSPKFSYDVKISEDRQKLQVKFDDIIVFNLAFQSNLDYELIIQKEISTNFIQIKEIIGKFKNNDIQFKLSIVQYDQVNRLDFKLDAFFLKEILLQPKIEIEESHINYPFGIEKTFRTKIQALDFLWLKGFSQGILYIQKNSQQFIIDRDTFETRNIIKKNGRYDFSISITSNHEIFSLHNIVNSYYYVPLCIKLGEKSVYEKRAENFISIDPKLSIINLWRRKQMKFIRVFNPSENEIKTRIKGALIKEKSEIVNLLGEKISTCDNFDINVPPWKILTLKLF